MHCPDELLALPKSGHARGGPQATGGARANGEAAAAPERQTLKRLRRNNETDWERLEQMEQLENQDRAAAGGGPRVVMDADSGDDEADGREEKAGKDAEEQREREDGADSDYNDDDDDDDGELYNEDDYGGFGFDEDGLDDADSGGDDEGPIF